jgi:hypothetical protein
LGAPGKIIAHPRLQRVREKLTPALPLRKQAAI